MTEKIIKCPDCGSKSYWKDGTRKTPDGRVQRYFCEVVTTGFPKGSLSYLKIPFFCFLIYAALQDEVC